MFLKIILLGVMVQRVAALAVIVSMLLLATAASAYTSYISDPAVINNGTSGQLTHIQLNVTSGNGNVSIKGPASVAQDTLSSAETGAAYAARYLGMNLNDYNFSYHIMDNNSAVSGPSAGLAFTLLAISGLEQKPLLNNFAVTGTISQNGTAGLIGGIFDKASAAAAAGKKFMIVPYTTQQSLEYMFYYATQQDLGIPLVQAKNASAAASYAFGTTSPSPLTYNYSVKYQTANLPYENESCNSCNITYFSPLENFTINFTSSEINSINGNFSSLKSQMLANLANYSAIGTKGYLYTASDLAFNEYVDAFTVANTNNASLANASATVHNIVNYCSSIQQPQMTSQNYEYVVGGQFRLALAQTALNTSISELNASTSSDAILLGLRNAGTAYAWCKAAYQMYNIAYSIGGANVTYGQGARSLAQQYLSEAAQSPTSGSYLAIASDEFSSGNYYASIYASVYSEVFGSVSAFSAGKAAAVYKNATAEQFGIWPKEFAASAGFFLYQANATNSQALKNSYLASAYSSALLSSQLSSANMQIKGSLVNYTATYPQSISGLQTQLNEVFAMLTVIFIMLILIFMILLKNEIKARQVQAKQPQRKRR